MVIRKTPSDLDKYIAVSKDNAISLNKNGFKPIYMDNKFLYYKKTDELLAFVLLEDDENNAK